MSIRGNSVRPTLPRFSQMASSRTIVCELLPVLERSSWTAGSYVETSALTVRGMPVRRTCRSASHGAACDASAGLRGLRMTFKHPFRVVGVLDIRDPG